MFNLWNKAIDTLLRSYFESIRYFLITVTIVGLYYGEFPVEGVFTFTLAMLVMGYIVSIIFRKYSKRKLNFIMVTLLGITSSLIAVHFSLPEEPIYFKACSFIYFFILWKKGMNFLLDEEDLIMYRNKFIISIILIFSLTIITFGLGSLDWYFNILNKYLVSYIVVSIVFFARTSLVEAYNKKYGNSINKNRNMIIFTVLSTAIVLLIVLFTSTSFLKLGEFWAVDYIIDKIVNLLIIILYPVILLLSNISMNLKEKFLENTPEGDLFSEGDFSANQELYNEAYKTNIIYQISEILKWAILVGLFALVLYFIYKTFKNLYIEGQDEEQEWEEREFVLNVNDIKKGIKNQMINLTNNLKRVIKKPNSLKELPIIRRVYIETILKLSKKGFYFKNYFTPKEYLNKITDKKYIEAGFDILTDYYNEARYSNGKITENKIQEALNIKEKIDNI